MEKTVHLLIMYTMLVLTVLLFHKGRKHPRSLMLAIYASVEVLTNGWNSFTLAAGNNYFYVQPFTHFVYKPLYCLWVPLFYFYFRYCFSNDFRIQKKHWHHFIPFAFLIVAFISIWIFKGNRYIYENLYIENSSLYNLSLGVDAVVKIQYLFYNFLMIRSLLRLEKRRELQPTIVSTLAVDIRWLRFIVYGYALASLGGIIYFIFHMLHSPVESTINVVSITYFFLFFFAIFYDTITHKPFDEEVKPKGILVPTDDMQQLMQRVDKAIRENKMYLEPDLSLQQIAETLNEKERNISQAINTIEKRNVNDYINALRIEHACTLLLANKEKPVFEVMYESGFGTKGAFNQAFKKATQMTPTDYRKVK